MINFAAEMNDYGMNSVALSNVRIGLVGLGNRGMATLRRYLVIEGAEIVDISDIDASKCRLAQEFMKEEGRVLPQIESCYDICRDPNVNLIYCCTNWDSHTNIAIDGMRNGKHVAMEVPVATTLADCRRLIAVSKETEMQCIMVENCCYDTFHLGVLGMIREGLLGEVTHCEGAYIHYLAEDAARGFMGNPYPTHALGPICQILDGDTLKSLVSINGLNHINNTLVMTEQGRSILLQFDETTPRPYNRLQTTCGTLGFVQKYPIPCVQIGEKTFMGNEAEELVESHIPTEFKQLIEDGKVLGVPNLMNYIMDRRLVDGFLKGRKADISIYDASLWSSIIELSARSASQGGATVNIEPF